METPHVCVVDIDGQTVGALRVESTPQAIAGAVEHYGSNSAHDAAATTLPG